MLAAMSVPSAAATSQAADSVPRLRHILAIDYSRVRPFRHSYDVVVLSADSVAPIGSREVKLVEYMAADSSVGWMLVESRSGVVSSTDSIFLATDLRPLRWRSVLGAASLDMAFSSDSMNGSIRVGAAVTYLALGIPPDLIVSASAIEMLAALLPLTSTWSDSANAVSIDLAGARVEPTELMVAGEDSVVVAPGAPARASWVLALRSTSKETRVWVDRETGGVLRAQFMLPAHVGTLLVYRLRPAAPTEP